MTWWQKLFGGSVEKKPVKRLQDMDQNTGEIDSPEFLEYLKVKGFQYNHRRLWWQRVWTTSIPWKDWQNPDPENCIWELPLPGTKQIWETYVFDVSTKEWTYRIVDPARIGQPGSGYYQDGWCIWEENIGKKE